MRRATRARGQFPSEQAALKCLYSTIRSLDPTGRGRRRWMNRWNTALNAFAITFGDRLLSTLLAPIIHENGGGLAWSLGWKRRERADADVVVGRPAVRPFSGIEGGPERVGTRAVKGWTPRGVECVVR